MITTAITKADLVKFIESESLTINDKEYLIRLAKSTSKKINSIIA